MRQRDGAPRLRQGGDDGGQLASGVDWVAGRDAEGQQRVDGVTGARAIRIGGKILVRVAPAAAAVAVGVEPVRPGRVARVGCGAPGPVVGFLDVHLRAPDAADLVGVAVVVAVGAGGPRARRVLARHGSRVQRSIAVAAGGTVAEESEGTTSVKHHGLGHLYEKEASAMKSHAP